MNYIKRLERDSAVLAERCATLDRRIQHFRSHLAGEKFVNADDKGERKDWISVTDVVNWLDIIESYS
jgi:hypothetical protein